MSTPLVSICCITYNHEPYIRKCLEGFVVQKTDFPFEVLIHDDASTDRTAEIIREFQQKYPEIIKPILQTENQYSKGISISATYNFPRVSGKYVAMCEGDDWWLTTDKLQKQVEYMEAHPDCSMCFTRGKTYVVEEDRYEKLYSDTEEGDYALEDFIGGGRIPTASMLMRTEVIERYRKSAHGCWAGDRILELSAATCGKLHGLPITTIQYNMHVGGVSANFYNLDLQLRQYKIEMAHFPQYSRTLVWDYIKKIILNPYNRRLGIPRLGALYFGYFFWPHPGTALLIVFQYLLYKCRIIPASRWHK